VKLFAALVVGDVLLFAMGFAWLADFAHLPKAVFGIGMQAAWAHGVLPFILGDLLKIVLTAAAVPAAWGVVDVFKRQG
jgi:biotin transport system substrate-specific component